MTEKHSTEHIFEEKTRIGKLSQIREIVFGAQDGLLVPLGVISSVAGAFNNNHIVIIAGISEALAGAFSMATGAYLASQAERQIHLSEMRKERASIKKWPKEEREELVLLFEKEGVSRKNAEIVVENIATSEQSFFNTMIQKEFGLEPEPPDSPMGDAYFIGLSYLLAAAVPLFPYFFLSGWQAIISSIASTLVALFIIGLVKGKFASHSYFKSGLQVMLIGGASGVGGYILGTILPHVLGIK